MRNFRKRHIIVTSLLLLGAAALLTFIRAPRPRADPPAAARAQTVRLVPVGGADGEPVQPAAEQRARKPYCYTVLLSGLDRSGGGSDTNLLMRFDVPNRRIDLVSLPRDTLLHHEWYSNKLNYAYASGGIEVLRSEVENLLGIPVDYYITVDLAGFVALIDRLGGVDFDIPVDMDYDDPAQDLHIHFSRGFRHLNGQQAMEVVRWRKNNDGGGYPDADIGRIATQQAFLRAAAAQAARIGNVPALAQTIFTCVKTDLTAGNLVWLGGEALRVDAEDIRFHTLPGDGAGSYRRESVYVLDPEQTLTLVNEALNPYDLPIAMEETDILVP